MTDETALPDDFNGTVRLFPLPDFVLFPHVVTPLHIFEPRYRAMTEAALESDQVIAMALLKSDWDDYQGQPPMYPVVCIDRKSVVEGKSVDLGGRRIIKKKKHRLSRLITCSIEPI